MALAQGAAMGGFSGGLEVVSSRLNEHLSTYVIYWPIFGISWEYLRNIMGISWEYLRNIFGISWEYYGFLRFSSPQKIGG